MQSDLYESMSEALQEAEKALSEGEVPVGAVLIGPEGHIVSRAHNQPISLNDPTAHAEILAMRRASLKCGNYRLPGSVLVVTIEPCIMCVGAALNARIARIVYGAPDPKSGAAGSVFDLTSDNRLNHRIEVTSGIMENECRTLIQSFFRDRRSS